MTLRNFQIFVEVCNQGSMSAAAAKLFISQSAVSQIIKDMEQHYGTVLFHRVSHKLYLTDAGKKLYSHALKMVQYSSLIEMSMKDASKTAALRIGSVSAEIMVDIISEYRQLHPELSFSLIHTTRNNIDMLLNSSQLDVAIVSGTIHMSGYRQYPLTVFENLFACNARSCLSELLSPDHPVLSVEEAAKFPIYVCSIGEETEQALHSIFSSRDVPYNIAGTFLHHNGVIEAAAKDLGIILVNRTNYEHSRSLLKEINVENIKIKSSISLICSERNAANPFVCDLIEFARNNFESIRSRFPEYRCF